MTNNVTSTVLFIAFLLYSMPKLEAKQNYTLGFLLPISSLISGRHAEYYVQALLIALDDVKKDKSLLPNINLKWILNDTQCDELLAVRQQFWQLNHGVDAFFGPGCHCVIAGRNAAAFDKPMMSYKCRDGELSNKKLYPTVARTSTNNIHLTLPLIALLRNFNWTRVAVVVQNEQKWLAVEKFANTKLKEVNITVAKTYEINQQHFQFSLQDINNSVKKLQNQARIVILLMEHSLIVEYMLVAYKEGLVQTGEYVFIGFQLDMNNNHQEVPMKWYFSGMYGAMHIEKSIRSFVPLLIMHVRKDNTQVYKAFNEKIKRLSRTKPFYTSKYPDCLKWRDHICLFWWNATMPSIHTAFLYDAIYTYAIALNKTLALNEVPTGRNIIKHLMGLRFQSISGCEVAFDDNADVDLNVTLLDQDYVNGSKSSCDGPFDADRPCKIMREIADFWPDPNVPGGQIYKQRKKIVKLWQGRKTPPADTPKCGFHNEHCRKTRSNDKLKLIGGLSAGAIVLFLLLLLYIVSRHYRIKNKHSLLWKIDYSEISFERRNSIESCVIGSSMQDSRINLIDEGKINKVTDIILEDFDDEQTVKFTTVGKLKGNYVAIKRLSNQSVDLTRVVLNELKLMLEIRHDNLNAFIGACVEPPNICIITNYCSKGSLQDILENEEVKLDYMFILIFLYDIVKGMTFLHSTEIKVHGNLKSSNCVVDTSWQLKLTDYGLNTFKSQHIEPYSRDHKDMLWKAPELLISPSLNQDEGTQMGDVYSFAIILQEMHTRKGPYSHNFEEIRDIIEHVKAMESPPYRPIVPNAIPGLEEFIQLMKECWTEVPEERPTFSELKKHIHRLLINRQMKTNIVDNVIRMGRSTDTGCHT